MLENLQNYYVYANLVRTGHIVIQSNQISNQTWRSHYEGIFNILLDGIETNFVQNLFITVDFGNNETVDLVINDYYINLLFWYPIIALGDKEIRPQHIFFKEKFTRDNIKEYLDKFFVIPRKQTIPNKVINNVIADTLYHFMDIDRFSMYIANTLNLEDSIELMNASPEYYNLLHADLSNEPLDNIKNKGMEIVRQAQKIIINAEELMGHEHCLRNPFCSGEGISAKQYKDNSINIGTKPDGQGSIYHERINQSYITGGLNQLMYQFIDSASARVAQIISKKNVGDSGGFARILGLNNVNTFLNPDPNYDCGTNNYVEQYIPNKEVLKMLYNRYYRFSYNSPLLKIGANDDHLIGKTILLRSPIFCASYANGNGVCYHCYGDLAYTNHDISIGRIASEIITSQYTQIRLSAKHLLEPKVKMIHWTPEFSDYFQIDINSIQLRHDLLPESLKGWKMLIDFDNIQLENEDDFYRHNFYMDGINSTTDEGPFFNEYITSFILLSPDGNAVEITSTIEDDDDEEEISSAKMYITNNLSDVIRKHLSIDDDSDMIEVPLTALEGIDIFILKMENNDIGKNLDMFDDYINKKAVTKKFTISELVSKLQLNVLRGNIYCASVHLEVILANQVANIHDRLLKPEWRRYNEPYELLTLNEALKDHNSPIISLTYRKLADTLKYPLSFKKFGPSIFDLFFIRKPKKFINADHEILEMPNKRAMQDGEMPVVFIHDHKGRRPVDIKAYMEPFSQTPKTNLDD